MQSALRVGRLGSLNLHLHYTWLLAIVLMLWWSALLWLPDNFPGWNGRLYWAVAVAVVLLYLLSVVLHEVVHTAVAGTGQRNVYLFPFGAAVPVHLNLVEPSRAILAVAVGPVFSLALGGALLLAGGGIGDTDGAAGAVRAILLSLGMLNLGLGLINLIPGLPFDGGWLLAATLAWFTGEREGSNRIPRAIGALAALLLILAGLLVGLATEQWLLALALVLAGWAAREAALTGQRRGLVHTALEQLKARNFMESVRPGEAVHTSQSVADMVKAHPRYPPHAPLPVVDEQGALTGIVTLAAADKLLQGTWPATPVRAVMRSPDEVQAVEANSPLTEVLAVADAREGTPDEEMPIPVLDGGRLVGSIEPGRLEGFKQVGEEFGLEETTSGAGASQGLLSRLAAILPLLFLIAAMAILGNIALRTDPAELKQAITDVTGAGPKFSGFTPDRGDIVDLGENTISVEISAPTAITTATLQLDGQPVKAELSGSSPMTQTLTAQVSGLAQGLHTVRVTAETEAGRTASEQWQFRVIAGGAAALEEPTPEPTPLAVPEPLQVVRFEPDLGSRRLAGQPVEIRVELEGAQPPEQVELLLDGQALDASIAPVEGADGRYAVTASAPPMRAGSHRLMLNLEDGRYSYGWTFSALQPDDDNAYFEETGYFVSQPFLRYWQENGGLRIFGYPISDVMVETEEGTETTYRAQYFERARFELHPELGNQVVLGRLGAILEEPEPPADPLPDAEYFEATGHNVSGVFLRYWQENGGLAVFGYPITEQRVETNPLDGKEYTVQYFERNRFEHHPEFAGTENEVLLGQLGTQLYREKYNR